MNKVIMMGRIVHTPELKNTQSGVAVCKFSIAVDRRFKVDGEKVTDFFDIVAWRQTAEFVAKYFGKGQMIAVVGELQTRSYETNEGQKRRVFEIVADSVEFCGSKKDNAPDAERPATEYQKPQKNDDFQTIEECEDIPF